MVKKKKLTKPKENRKQKFIELVAQGITPYQAAVQANYSLTTAKNKSQDMVERWLPEIEALKPIVEEIVKEKLKYNIIDCFNEFEEVRKLALLPNIKGEFCNLTAATKAIENKGKLVGAFEADNKQKNDTVVQKVFVDADTKKQAKKHIQDFINGE